MARQPAYAIAYELDDVNDLPMPMVPTAAAAAATDPGPVEVACTPMHTVGTDAWLRMRVAQARVASTQAEAAAAQAVLEQLELRLAAGSVPVEAVMVPGEVEEID